MCVLFRGLIASIPLAVACADAPQESTTRADELSANRLTGNRLTGNRVNASRLATSRLAVSRLGSSQREVNPDTAAALLSTDDGREVFAAVVACALPDDVTLIAHVGGSDLEYPGELGLARDWLDRPLSHEGQGWVSACMFARVSGSDVALPISLRGPTPALSVSHDERVGWSLQEGAFFGNLFSAPDRPLQAYACRGRDQAAGAGGGLVERVCTEPDPANPGHTLCGFVYAGDCGHFAADQACESFSHHGTFYQGCHTAPLRDHRGCDGDDAVFQQVITSYVMP